MYQFVSAIDNFLLDFATLSSVILLYQIQCLCKDTKELKGQEKRMFFMTEGDGTMIGYYHRSDFPFHICPEMMS